MKRESAIAAVAVAFVLLAGCDFEGDTTRFREEFHSSYPLKSGGHFSLETLNGSVELTGWDKDEVEITGFKYAGTENALKAIKIDVVSTGDEIRIRTIPPSGYRSGMGARYAIHMPRKATIDRVDSSNGKIQIENVDSAALLKTSNGSVHVSGTHGSIEVRTSNATVELREHDGDAVIHTSNGAIRAEKVRGAFEASTTNSSIHARVFEPEANRPLKLESTNGSITLAMESLRNNPIHATTSNSSITLRLPQTAGAQLRAQTSNGSVNSDFEMNVRKMSSKSFLEGTIGSGGPAIDLTTSNGAIRVEKL